MTPKTPQQMILQNQGLEPRRCYDRHHYLLVDLRPGNDNNRGAAGLAFMEPGTPKVLSTYFLCYAAGSDYGERSVGVGSWFARMNLGGRYRLS